jgi:hypothetical protein
MADTLSSEILELVLGNILRPTGDEDGSSTVDVLCVCKLWGEIGQRLLWRDLVLRDGMQMIKLAERPQPSNLSRVISLTLTFSPFEAEITPDPHKFIIEEDLAFVQKHGNRKTRQLWLGLEQLLSILPQMTQLTNFSFYTQKHEEMTAPDGFWLLHEQVYGLIKALPSSVRYLELDTRCWENLEAPKATENICDLIAKRFHILEHVRLRLAHLCPGLFTSSNTLRTLVINMTNGMYRTETQECGVSGSIRDWDTMEERDNVGRTTRRTLVETIPSSLAESPNVKKLLLLDSKFYNDGYYDIICVRDLVNSTTRVSLASCISDIDHKVLSCPAVHVRYFNHDGEETDAAGHIADVEELLEDETWASTEQGSRLPAALKDTLEGRTYKWAKYDRYFNTQEISEKYGPQQLEAFGTGQIRRTKKVHPFVVDHVDDVEAPKIEKVVHEWEVEDDWEIEYPSDYVDPEESSSGED